MFTLPRLAVAMLSSGILLTILAVTALAGGPDDQAPVEEPGPDVVAGATRDGISPAAVSRAQRPATSEPSSEPTATATATAGVAHAEEGAIEAPAEEIIEAARLDESADGRFQMPLAAWVRVTDRYGAPRGAGLIHGGIDLAVGGHVPIHASCDGTVDSATYSSVYGNYVLLACGDGWSTLYGHLSTLNVQPGDSVTKGTGLGRSGSTGYSTGEHLHFEIIYQGSRVNPEHYLDFKIPPGTPLSDGPIYFPREGYSNEPAGSSSGSGDSSSPGEAAEPTPTEVPPTATPTVTNTPTPTATPTVTNTPTPTPTPSPPPPTPTPTPRPVFR